MLENLHHASITVGDIDECLELYRDLLGMEVAMDMEFKGEGVEKIMARKGVRFRVLHLKHKDAVLELLQFHEPEKSSGPTPVAHPTHVGLTHIAFTVKDIQSLTDGDEVAVGGAVVRVLHTPGHTPGSVSLVTGGAVLTGDTLFPGGPGHSRTNEALQQEIVSITTWLHTLPDGTLVLPGHGDTTTVGESKAEYEVFAGKDHDPDLHGDVLWLES